MGSQKHLTHTCLWLQLDSYPAAEWNAPRLLYRFPSHSFMNSTHPSVAPALGTVLALKAQWKRGYGSEQGRQSYCPRGAYRLAKSVIQEEGRSYLQIVLKHNERSKQHAETEGYLN